MMSFKLSLKNLNKSLKDYSIYFFTLIFGITIFYVFNSIDAQSSMLEVSKSRHQMIQSLVGIISVVSVFISVILGFLIVYANNFLIKRRKKELGLYMTLGMSKGKISKLLLIETVIIGVISLAIGLIVGIFASQLLSVFVAKMFEADMAKFSFVFSKAALIKTCIYFGIIYLLVMFFNVVTISRYKLINLINAGKKNEVVKLKNKFVTLILFVLSISFIGAAYYLLKHDALLYLDNRFYIMIGLGCVGTLLFFASLSGFLLRTIQLNKNIYFKDLNMFVLRQINSKINTNTISMTVICLMLFLAICILSGALSLVNTFNTDLSANNLNDITIKRMFYKEINKDKYSLADEIKKDGFDFSKYFEQYTEYNVYSFEDEQTYMSKFISESSINELKKEYGDQVIEADSPLEFMKESEYNQLMEMSGRDDLKISLNDDEYIMTTNFGKLVEVYDRELKINKTIKIGDNEYTPKYKNCIQVATENSNMDSNVGKIIVKDFVIDNSNSAFNTESNIIANYGVDDSKIEDAEEKFDSDIKAFYKSNGIEMPYDNINTKLSIKESSVGLTAILTFLGIYLGIIFSITSAAILAIQQLSQSSDNKVRYEVLRKIGVDSKMINSSIFVQIAIFFMLPLSVALVHSIVGLSELNKIISIFANVDVLSNIIITTLFIIIVYGGYFLATYIASKNIVKERERII